MGKPVAFVLTPGQQHEATVFEQLMTGGMVKRPGGGRPRVRPKRVCGDKGTAAARFALIFDGGGSATPFQGKGMKGGPVPSIKSCIGFAIE